MSGSYNRLAAIRDYWMPRDVDARAEVRVTDLDEILRKIEPAQEPVEFDHGIGAARFRVARGAFWWHVLIGDSPAEHGKFHSRAGAEKMAAVLLREFRNGAFAQHEAPPPKKLVEPAPAQVPYCYVYEYDGAFGLHRELYPHEYNGRKPDRTVPLYTHPPKAEPEPVQEPVAVHQFRKQYCANWYDGHPDHTDGGGPYEERTLYLAPPQRPSLTGEEIDALALEVRCDPAALRSAIERKVRGEKE